LVGGGYPSIPHKETAVCIKVYRESNGKELDIRVIAVSLKGSPAIAARTLRAPVPVLGAFEFLSDFSFLRFVGESTPTDLFSDLRANQHFTAFDGNCGGNSAWYFPDAAGPPAVFSKRFVFELIEDERG
jgi:hypothetical protein